MRVAMHQPHYLPWLGYFDKLDRADLFVLVDHVQFERKNWQNRNYVKSASGPVLLTVPVVQNSRAECIVDKVIDDRKPWRRKHHRTIEQSYRGSRYWAAHSAQLLRLYDRPWRALVDLAVASTAVLSREFEITTPWIRSSSLSAVTGKKTEMIAELCHAVGADIYLSGDTARCYLDVGFLRRNGITVEWQSFVHPEYSQLHPNIGFLPRMAALDLLLNEGSAGFAKVRAARAEASASLAVRSADRQDGEARRVNDLVESARADDRAAS